MTSLRVAIATASCLMLVGMFSENTDLNSVDLQAQDPIIIQPARPIQTTQPLQQVQKPEVDYSLPTFEEPEEPVTQQVAQKSTQKSTVTGHYGWRRGPLGLRRWRVWIPANSYSRSYTYSSRPRARIFRGRASSCGPFGCY